LAKRKTKGGIGRRNLRIRKGVDDSPMRRIEEEPYLSKKRDKEDLEKNVEKLERQVEVEEKKGIELGINNSKKINLKRERIREVNEFKKMLDKDEKLPIDFLKNHKKILRHTYRYYKLRYGR